MDMLELTGVSAGMGALNLAKTLRRVNEEKIWTSKEIAKNKKVAARTNQGKLAATTRMSDILWAKGLNQTGKKREPLIKGGKKLHNQRLNLKRR